MTIHANAFQYEESAKALSLYNSKGKKQGRIHLFTYDGPKDQDRYAIAAEKIEFSGETKPSLGWLDRKFYILYAHKDNTGNQTFYKINKNSLQKRTGIKLSEFEIDQHTGVCTKFEETIGSLGNKLNNWKSKIKNVESSSNQAFIQNFFHSLSSSRVSDELYTEIYFQPSEEANLAFSDKDNSTQISRLVIRYGKDGMSEPEEINSSSRYLKVFGSAFKDIVKGLQPSYEVIQQLSESVLAKQEVTPEQKVTPKKKVTPKQEAVAFNPAQNLFLRAVEKDKNLRFLLILNDNERKELDSQHVNSTIQEAFARGDEIKSAKLITKDPLKQKIKLCTYSAELLNTISETHYSTEKKDELAKKLNLNPEDLDKLFEP